MQSNYVLPCVYVSTRTHSAHLNFARLVSQRLARLLLSLHIHDCVCDTPSSESTGHCLQDRSYLSSITARFTSSSSISCIIRCAVGHMCACLLCYVRNCSHIIAIIRVFVFRVRGWLHKDCRVMHKQHTLVQREGKVLQQSLKCLGEKAKNTCFSLDTADFCTSFNRPSSIGHTYARLVVRHAPRQRLFSYTCVRHAPHVAFARTIYSNCACLNIHGIILDVPATWRCGLLGLCLNVLIHLRC